MPRFGLAVFFALVCTAGATFVRAQAPTPSVGDVLLLSNSTDASVSAAVRDALGSSDPAVRRVAGRVIAAVPHAALRPALVGALAREQDAEAGAEFVRDVLHLSNGGDLAFVEPQSRRLGGPALVALAEWLARVQPDGFASRLPTLAGADQPLAIRELVVTAASQHPQQRDRILRSWMAAAGEGGWDASLSGAFGGSDIAASDAALFVDALNAAQPHVRQETVWFVVQTVVEKLKVPAQVIDAAAAPREGAAAWEAFGRELIARRGKPPAGGDRHVLIETEGRLHMPDIYRIAAASQLTDAERGAASSLAQAQREPFADADLSVAVARTPTALAPGALAATLRAADCQTVGSLVARATVVYAPDGFPLHVTVNPSGLSRQCQSAWTALARTTVADEAEPVRDEGQGLVLPLNAEFIACADAAAEPQPAAPRAVPTSKIRQPRKIKDVKPDYPNEAMNQRIQGVVLLKGIVSRAGCLSSLRVIRSIPPLDAAAVAAVSAWRFEPTLLDGVPVPVLMTVTVNFTLQ